MNDLEQLLEAIGKGDPPSIILVGGSDDYLVNHHYLKIRERLLEANPGIEIEAHPEGADLGKVADSFRTHSLFGGSRLVSVPEVQAFVSSKELDKLLHKATSDWESAKTDRKRKTAIAKLMHVLGLSGLSLEQPDAEIIEALGAKKKVTSEILEAARREGQSASRGEGDAAILAEMIQNGGAPGAILLLKTGELPADSPVLDHLRSSGALIRGDLTRASYPEALQQAISEVSADHGVEFEPGAIKALEQRLGVTRMLEDKYSTDIPDMSLLVSEAVRLAGFVGEGKKVTRAEVESQVEARAGGRQYEFSSLFSEGKILDALEKLHDLVSQAKRNDPRATTEILYGRYLFSLADEIRTLIAVHSFLRSQGMRSSRMNYNQFKGQMADQLGVFLKERGMSRQKLHPFVLFKKYEAAGRYGEKLLARALQRIGEIELERKSGGVPPTVSLEALLLSIGAHTSATRG